MAIPIPYEISVLPPGSEPDIPPLGLYVGHVSPLDSLIVGHVGALVYLGGICSRVAYTNVYYVCGGVAEAGLLKGCICV